MQLAFCRCMDNAVEAMRPNLFLKNALDSFPWEYWPTNPRTGSFEGREKGTAVDYQNGRRVFWITFFFGPAFLLVTIVAILVYFKPKECFNLNSSGKQNVIGNPGYHETPQQPRELITKWNWMFRFRVGVFR